MKEIDSCISFDSYIKPQPDGKSPALMNGCISFDSYIKPQLGKRNFYIHLVVYLLIPTSNHNVSLSYPMMSSLYIF